MLRFTQKEPLCFRAAADTFCSTFYLSDGRRWIYRTAHRHVSNDLAVRRRLVCRDPGPGVGSETLPGPSRAAFGHRRPAHRQGSITLEAMEPDTGSGHSRSPNEGSQRNGDVMFLAWFPRFRSFK